MRALETDDPFPSAGTRLRELTRTGAAAAGASISPRRFSAPGRPPTRSTARPRGRSGLDEWSQERRSRGGTGLRRGRDPRTRRREPSRTGKLPAIMKDIQWRGFGWGDIALLARRTPGRTRHAWLNDMDIPSSPSAALDVRARRSPARCSRSCRSSTPPRTTLLCHVRPRDGFSPAHRGQSTGRMCSRAKSSLRVPPEEAPALQGVPARVPRLVEDLFAGLFRSAGYLPLYDLVSEAYVRFDVFSLVRRRGSDARQAPGSREGVRRLGCEQPAGFSRRGRRPGTDSAAAWAIDVPRSAPSVNAMTIHKAKGLGFPVVVVLLYGESATDSSTRC